LNHSGLPWGDNPWDANYCYAFAAGIVWRLNGLRGAVVQGKG